MEAKLKAVVAVLADLSMVLDEDGRYVEIITAKTDLLYVEQQKVVGRLLSDIFPEKEAACFLGIIQKTLASGENQRIEYELDVPAGKIWFEGRTAVYGKSVGGKRTVVWIATDITQQKQFAMRERHSQKMEVLGTLAGGIAHDFNNILGIIGANTDQCLAELAPDHSLRPYLDSIRLAQSRADGLVKQILTLASAEASVMAPTDLSVALGEALDIAAATLPGNVEMHQHIKTRDAIILADTVQIHQVVLNLCTNAYQAMEKEGGLLEVVLEREDHCECHKHRGEFGCLILRISDQGPGIPAQILDRIFDPFFTTKGVGAGTGLGLAIVQRIVEDHGGEISVDSTPGEGTTFTVTFPAVRRRN